MTDRHDAFRTGGEGESSEEPPAGDGTSGTPPGVRDPYAADHEPLRTGEEGVAAFLRAAAAADEVDVTPVDEANSADYDRLECAHARCTSRATHWLAAVDEGVRYSLAACSEHRDDFIP